MRTFSLPDDEASLLYKAASALLKALNESTDTPPPTTLPPSSPPQSDLEKIIAGIEYAPPPGGWPPRDPDQSSITHKDTDYIHVNSKGGGWYTFPGYVERIAKLLPSDLTTIDPYNGDGLLAVLSLILVSQDQRNKVMQKLRDNNHGDQVQVNRIIDTNGHADPDFEGALKAVLTGSSPENVYAFYQASPVVKKPLGFEVADLQRGKDAAATFVA